jgi:hypothetical protein
VAVNYAAALKDTRMNDVINAIDANANPGLMEICTAAFAQVLVTITFSKPSFSESGGIITMQGAPKSAMAANGGTAAVARIKDGGGTNVVINNLSVGVSGADINLNTTTINTGQLLTLSSGTITHSP